MQALFQGKGLNVPFSALIYLRGTVILIFLT